MKTSHQSGRMLECLSVCVLQWQATRKQGAGLARLLSG
nr:hypothetical protein [Mucilaginibacter sp. FT3.2]